ncbi:MAG: DUF4136 domain-containing protein [Proteobacteria bacterium]|nr:DUF4136 domain-containing protein [Pseudomonadota bacterium]
MTSFRISVITLLGLILASCSNSIRSDVARFHNLPAPSGESFLIVAKDEAKDGGLEFAQYAGLIRARLMDAGYQPVTEGTPQLVVEVDYRISDGEEKIRSRPGYGYGYGYGGYGYGHYGFHHFHHSSYLYGGYGGYGGYSSGVYSVTVYSRVLEMDIIRADGEKLFEGHALSIGRDNRMPEIMPYLVQAMFTNFPGESGVTKLVEIEIPGGGRY